MENTTNTPPNEITVADLEVVRSIIDLASTRGAFRANELKDVGEVYNKLTQFLEAVIAQAKAQEADSNTELTDTPTQGE